MEEEEITVDTLGESSTPNQIEGESSTANQTSFLLLPRTSSLSKQTMFHQINFTKFTQQELPAWKPLITPKWAMTIFMVVGILSIPISIVTLTASHNVVQIVHRYDQECLKNTTSDPVTHIQNASANHRCTVTLRVPKPMKHPVFVFYELTRFHQNHRRYLKSRSTKQHQGEGRKSVDSCHPISRSTNKAPIVPCGLIAWSLFNDTFDFNLKTWSVSNNTFEFNHIPVAKTGIAWKSDVGVKFSSKVYPENFPNNNNNTERRSHFPVGGARLDPALPLSRDENLMVWMRAAPLPHFRKLYGRIERNLHAGQVLEVRILNVYNTYSFQGSKSLVLSTTSFLGGKNPFLGRAFLTMGVLCLVTALGSILVQLRRPGGAGGRTRLTWNRQPCIC